MKIAASILATCAFLALPIQAGAGQCASEIDGLSKVLAARDAGSGPTPGTPGSRAGQHPPTIAMNQEDQSGAASRAAAESGRPQHPPTAIMNRETNGMSSSSSSESEMRKDEHPPTATMNRETQGSAASPQDVQRQNQGQPTAAQSAKDDIAQSHTMAGAMTALERARMLDQQGQEAECLSAVGQAKLISGAR